MTNLDSELPLSLQCPYVQLFSVRVWPLCVFSSSSISYSRDREREDMLKRLKVSDFSESCPQFFKVYLPNQSSHRLRIPPAFVKYSTEGFPNKSTIASSEKRSWDVNLKEVDGHLYFQEGWQQFVHDNCLESGDFLIFSYGGNAQFYVKIYGKNGCRKEVSEPSREVDKEITHPRDNQTVERKSKRVAQGSNVEKPKSSMPIQKGKRAREEARKFVSEFPFFEVVMNPSYVNQGSMNIPSSFHNRYMEKDRHGVTLVASDRSWPVKLVKYRGNIWRFNRGWSTFCRDNTLEVDDVCIFELIEENDFVLKVSIFRCRD